MPHTIWFVPTNSSHVAKLKAMMDELATRGHQVRLLCPDAVQEALFDSRESVERAGYPYEVLPAGGFPGESHWSRKVIHRRKLDRVVRGFLDSHPADALVFGEDLGAVSRAFIRAARPRCIATVMVPDGLVLPPNPAYRRSLWRRLRGVLSLLFQRTLGVGGVRGTSDADLVLVMSEIGRRAFAQMGIAAERIRVVGSCEYDALAKSSGGPLSAAEEQALRGRLGLAHGRPVIFFAHQVVPTREETQAFVRMMISAARRCGGTLLVKFHPRGEDRPDAWRRWAGGEGYGNEDVVFARTECTTIDAVRLCAVCVTYFSTTVLEAFVWRTPVVLIQCVNAWFRLTYGSDYGAAIDVMRPEDLEPAIVSAATDPAVREQLGCGAEAALRKELFGLDGRSAERMADSVIDLIERRRGKG
jgi:hypothetical protein